uniref:myocilin opposite strand protein n=1 Tax=Jaculus jaculus TaxID=51337 RepID=UPI001E1B1C2E|nr:myocilin opposite strand protein [Jaculus jaculus]
MAQRSPAENRINLPYSDLASEVNKRRVAMATRNEKITKKKDESRELPSCLGMEQEPSPSKAYTMVPPAPPPSPANFTNSQANPLSSLVSSDINFCSP